MSEEYRLEDFNEDEQYAVMAFTQMGGISSAESRRIVAKNNFRFFESAYEFVLWYTEFVLHDSTPIPTWAVVDWEASFNYLMESLDRKRYVVAFVNKGAYFFGWRQHAN